MFKNAIRLPLRLLGIPLYLDITFLIILPLLAWLIGGQLGEFFLLTGLDEVIDVEPLLQGWTPYLLGLWAALALFVSVVIHELGHAVTGRIYGVETERITLWLLGGMAHFKEMPRQRGAEAVVAIAGPITSFLVAGVCAVFLTAIPLDYGGFYFVVVYTLYMNVILAVFNMIPALPLDGGRVLRSLLNLKMSRLKATQISAGISRVLAIALGLFGVLAFNLFMILIAFFIYMAVTAETRYALFTETLSRFHVDELMSYPVATLSPDMSVANVQEKMLAEARLAYPVQERDGSYVGQVTLSEVQRSPAHQTVANIMIDGPATIAVGTGANDLFDRMIRDDQHRLLVVDHKGDVVGIVTKTDLLRALQVASYR